MNASIAHAAVTHQLDSCPFVQGLLVRCMRRLEKESRNVDSNRGRYKECSQTEEQLIQDAALQLAISGSNKHLCAKLLQNAKLPRIAVDKLHELSLPNPMLALMNPTRLEENARLIDQAFYRGPTMPSRRLICAMDATYLAKGLQQMQDDGVPGLVGGPWSPIDSSSAFIPLSSTLDCKTCPRASVMQEFLLWCPNSQHRKTMSIASMPMCLAASQQDNESQTHAGNRDAWMKMDGI